MLFYHVKSKPFHAERFVSVRQFRHGYFFIPVTIDIVFLDHCRNIYQATVCGQERFVDCRRLAELTAPSPFEVDTVDQNA